MTQNQNTSKIAPEVGAQNAQAQATAALDSNQQPGPDGGLPAAPCSALSEAEKKIQEIEEEIRQERLRLPSVNSGPISFIMGDFEITIKPSKETEIHKRLVKARMAESQLFWKAESSL